MIACCYRSHTPIVLFSIALPEPLFVKGADVFPDIPINAHAKPYSRWELNTCITRINLLKGRVHSIDVQARKNWVVNMRLWKTANSASIGKRCSAGYFRIIHYWFHQPLKPAL